MAHETGTLTPGKHGDLVVLDGDPAQDLMAFTRISLHDPRRAAGGVRQAVEPYEVVFTGTGSVKRNVEPAPTSLSTQIRPPCPSTILRTIAKPRPVLLSPAYRGPPGLAEGLKQLPAFALGYARPLIATEIRTAPPSSTARTSTAVSGLRKTSPHWRSDCSAPV